MKHPKSGVSGLCNGTKQGGLTELIGHFISVKDQKEVSVAKVFKVK